MEKHEFDSETRQIVLNVCSGIPRRGRPIDLYEVLPRERKNLMPWLKGHRWLQDSESCLALVQHCPNDTAVLSDLGWDGISQRLRLRPGSRLVSGFLFLAALHAWLDLIMDRVDGMLSTNRYG
jgi:hypothetical protein